MLDEVRAEVFPILDDTHRTIATLATIAERIQNGEGSVGRLVSNDTMVRAIEQSITGLNSALDDIKATTKEARALAAKVNAGDDGVPALLANLQTVTRDIAQTTPRLPKIARNAEGASTDLPALLTQTQIATTELEKPLTQMGGMWCWAAVERQRRHRAGCPRQGDAAGAASAAEEAVAIRRDLRDYRGVARACRLLRLRRNRREYRPPRRHSTSAPAAAPRSRATANSPGSGSSDRAFARS